MKKLIFIILLGLFPFSLFSQKVTIQVLRAGKSARSEWQILDEEYNNVISGFDYSGNDSVTFSLEANKRYILKIAVSEIFNRNATLLTLILNAEPVILVKTDIGAGDHLFPFFTGDRNTGAKITGGTTALISEFPWQIYLISGNFQCGGSIIDSGWVVTAAHCTMNDAGSLIPASSMSVKVGANTPASPFDGKKYLVSQVIVHPAYNSSTHENDIALLKLQQPVNYPNAVPIKLVTSDDVTYGATDPGVLSWVTGWGLIHVNPNTIPANLQKVQLPVITNAQASVVWGPIPATDLMAGYLNGNKDACSGDSGGPLVVPVFGEYKLAGIVSWGSINCNTYGAYTRVSLFESWIRANTGIVKLYRPPAPSGEIVICQGTASGQYSVSNVPAATAYEWRILPSNAGFVSGNSANATVLWNQDFSGNVELTLRVTIDNNVSDWSGLKVNVLQKTKLLSQSHDTAMCAGQSITLNVVSAGNNLSYKWSRNGIILQDGSSPNLIIPVTTADDSGGYVCEISGSCGTVLSGVMNLTVLPVTAINFITKDVQVPFGNDISLEVKAAGHNLLYQWQKDGILIDNGNASTLNLYDVNAGNIGLYSTTVTGTCGTVTSPPIYLYVNKGDNSAEKEVFLWPSVTNDQFNVALSDNSFYRINIINSAGQLIRELTFCRYQTTVDVSSLAKGIYIITVFNDSFRKSLKIIKE
jgi:hypothetical protein